MAEIIYIAVGLLVAFFCTCFYRRGVKDGLSTARKTEPSPISKKPTSKAEKEAVKEEETDNEELRNKFETILNYDPYGKNQ